MHGVLLMSLRDKLISASQELSPSYGAKLKQKPQHTGTNESQKTSGYRVWSNSKSQQPQNELETGKVHDGSILQFHSSPPGKSYLLAALPPGTSIQEPASKPSTKPSVLLLGNSLLKGIKERALSSKCNVEKAHASSVTEARECIDERSPKTNTDCVCLQLITNEVEEDGPPPGDC